ncbi:MAG: hypothetical protein IJ852_00105 [Alphaproteobacteria bacterium]|nr:hypothetical protein [Alphaproteobacteria bacterium]
MRTTPNAPLLPICAENAPQKEKILRPECGADTQSFLSAVYKSGTQAKKRQADAPQYGRSMIEMLGVLAIIGVLSVGGIAGYSKAMQKYRVNKTIDQITQISNGIHTLYTARNNYEGLDIRLLAKAKIIPQELIDYSEETVQVTQSLEEYNATHPMPPQDDFDALFARLKWQMSSCTGNPATCTTTTTTQTFHGTNPFGGRVLLSVDGDGKAFSINYLGLPEDACIDVLTQDWGGASAGLIAAGVDSAVSSTYGCSGDKGSHVCADQLPVTVQKAMNLCATMNDSQSKGVILKFK